MGNAASNESSQLASSTTSKNPSTILDDNNMSIRLGSKSPGMKKTKSAPSGRTGKVVTIQEDHGYYIEPLKDSDSGESGRESNHQPRRGDSKRRQRNGPPSASSMLSSEGSSETISIPSLHGSLLRVHEKRDPLKYYEVIKVLGDGSMGSVSKVSRRQSAKGGSARKQFVRLEKQRHRCFGLFDPEYCGKFNIFCPIQKQPDDHHPNNAHDRTKQFMTHQSSSIITYDTHDTFYALKSIHLDRCKDDILRQELKNEIAILQRLDHPHIVKALETFNFKDRLYVVLELCSGGDLYCRDPYTETQACTIIHDILDAIAYMHARGITHRDLKFENIMFSSPDMDSVKVIDFGLSKKYSGQVHLHETVGTVYTMAPEVLRGDYDQKCDVWSLGVIAFMLLSSSLPFYGKSRQHVARMVMNGKFAFRGHRWKTISLEAKEFVTECLVTKAARRKTADQMMRHPFMHMDADEYRKGVVGFALMDQVQATIQTYCEYPKLKKLGLLVVAHKSTDVEIGWLRKVFNVFDTDVDGEVTLPEFQAVLKPYHYTEEDTERMFVGMDLDGTGKVHYSEFLAATLEAHGSIAEERLADAFDRLDCDDSGYITKENIMDFLGETISDAYANAIIDEADIVHDHRVSYEEFLAMWDDTNDERFKQTLEEVNNRRISFDDGSSLDNNSDDTESIVTETSNGTPSQEVTVELESGVPKDVSGGSFFYGIEKEKSIRGVWL